MDGALSGESMRNAGWIALGALFLAGWTWATGAWICSQCYVEGQATQDAAYGHRLDRLLERIEAVEKGADGADR